MNGVPLNIDWQQILLHLLNFLILFAGLYFLLYKPVKNFMEKRVQTYKDMDDSAREALKNAEDVNNEYKTKLAGADKEIAELREKARVSVEKDNQKRLHEAGEEAERIVSEAKAQAYREKEKILQEAQTEISEMVTDATEKLVLKASASEAFDQFLDAVEAQDKRGSDNE